MLPPADNKAYLYLYHLQSTSEYQNLIKHIYFQNNSCFAARSRSFNIAIEHPDQAHTENAWLRVFLNIYIFSYTPSTCHANNEGMPAKKMNQFTNGISSTQRHMHIFLVLLLCKMTFLLNIKMKIMSNRKSIKNKAPQF